MPKNIVILLDGTANEIVGHQTNILRLYRTLVKDETQLVFYHPGVGTIGAENSPSRYIRRAVEVWGLATGWGVDQNVKEAYRFLIEHYDDGVRSNGQTNVEPDTLYFFGFSRGAYTARVLAGFIHAVGLLQPENINLVSYAYGAYKNVSNDDDQPSGTTNRDPFEGVRTFERILRTRRPAIRSLGLFDTVGSVIEFTKRGPRFRRHAFSVQNKSVESVRHALAIDERRSMFQPQLWPAGQTYWGNPFNDKHAKPQDSKEVWFTGVHSDIGGGYAEEESGLAKITLAWMVNETQQLGLRFKQRTINSVVLGKGKENVHIAPDALADKHDSLTWQWKLAEVLPHRVRKQNKHSQASIFGWYWAWSKLRKIAKEAHVHTSVLARRQTASDFEQPNIPKPPNIVE